MLCFYPYSDYRRLSTTAAPISLPNVGRICHQDTVGDVGRSLTSSGILRAAEIGNLTFHLRFLALIHCNFFLPSFLKDRENWPSHDPSCGGASERASERRKRAKKLSQLHFCRLALAVPSFFLIQTHSWPFVFHCIALPRELRAGRGLRMKYSSNNFLSRVS